MNCHEFTPIMFDLARGRLELSARREGLAHAEICPVCARRLAQEQSLTQGLKTFAEAVKAEQTPSARVETNLLLALRASQQRQTVNFRRPFWQLNLIWRQLALVTVIALAVALAFWAARPEELVHRAANYPKSSTTGFNSNVPPPPEDTKKGIEQTPFSPPVRHTVALPVRYASKPPKALKARSLPAEVSLLNHAREIYTEYFPLNDAGSTAPSEEFQVLRVTLPRSAMASFGLPVNPAQANLRVNADVIIGADGIARAVRFVR